MRVVIFYQSSSLLLLSSSPLLASSRSKYRTSTASLRQIAVGTTGHQQQAPDRSRRYRTSAASARSQWALLDLNSRRQIAVGTTGPQQQSPDPSAHYWTSTASARSQRQTHNHRDTQSQTQSQTHTQSETRNRKHNHRHTITYTQRSTQRNTQLQIQHTTGHYRAAVRQAPQFDLPKRLPPDDLYEPAAEAASQSSGSNEKKFDLWSSFDNYAYLSSNSHTVSRRRK